MDKENVTHTHTMGYISVIKEKERNPAICDNISEPWGHYAKWNETKTNSVWLHLHGESKFKNKPTHA